MAGRRWTIEDHPKKKQILAAIAKGDNSLRSIAKQFDIAHANVRRYVAERLSDKVSAARTETDKQDGQLVSDQLKAVMDRMRKLYDACDDYLKDPANPDRYELGPRAWEIDIVYRTVEPDTDKMITRKESLDTLLLKLDEHGYQPWEVRMKHADPRKLIVETAGAITRQLELMAKIEGSIQDTVVNVTLDQKFLVLKQIIMDATKEAPQVRLKIAEALEKIEA